MADYKVYLAAFTALLIAAGGIILCDYSNGDGSALVEEDDYVVVVVERTGEMYAPLPIIEKEYGYDREFILEQAQKIDIDGLRPAVVIGADLGKVVVLLEPLELEFLSAHVRAEQVIFIPPYDQYLPHYYPLVMMEDDVKDILPVSYEPIWEIMEREKVLPGIIIFEKAQLYPLMGELVAY